MSKLGLFEKCQRVFDLNSYRLPGIHVECAPVVVNAITLGKIVWKQVGRTNCSTADFAEQGYWSQKNKDRVTVRETQVGAECRSRGDTQKID